MRVFLDVNTFFDFVLGREPFYAEVWQIITLAKHGDIICGTSPNNFPFAFYHLRKDPTKTVITNSDFKHRLAILRKTVSCSTLDGSVIDAAIAMPVPEDLEDAVIIQSAIEFKADVMITRDKQLLKNKFIKTLTPREFLRSWISK